MLKRLLNIGKSKRDGSALLVALIFTGLLVLVTIGVSGLISRETRLVKNLLDSTGAFYSAEAGVEMALLDIEENQPGFEINTSTIDLDNEDKQKIRYRVDSRTNRVPILANYELDLIGSVLGEEVTYQELRLNESIKIPFVDDLDNFVVEYYYPLADFLETTRLNETDILRWKLFGKNKLTGGIDSINEFSPVTNQSGGNGTTPDSPACIGPAPCWNAGTYFPSSFEDDQAGTDITINQFMEEHEQMYLIISNLLDPGLLQGVDLEKQDASSIYFRVIDRANINDLARKGGLVSPSAKIKAVGQSGRTEKTLEVEVAPDNFLPIFDFALYRPKL